MKAIFYLPAHPSYFDDEYTKEEINQAIRTYEGLITGIIFKGDLQPKVKEEFRLLREPGKTIQVVVDSAGLGGGRHVPACDKRSALEQYRQTSNQALQIHVRNITELLKRIRMRPEHKTA